MKRLHFLSFLILIIACGELKSQVSWQVIAVAYVKDGDTIPVLRLPELVIYPPVQFRNEAEARRFDKLMRNVKVVYPYAKMAGEKMREYEKLLAGISSEKERRKLMQLAEQELRDEFEDDLMNFSVSQGWILLKLIDRETGNSTYHIVAEFRGKFRAFFWQSFARIFGFNLKVRYDPTGTDRDIERIVTMIENGLL